MTREAKPQLLYLHLLRIIAAVAVIAIHSSAPLLYMMNTAPTLDWWNTNLINAFTRWAVPIYVMVSGTLLLDSSRQESFKEFIKKRAGKIGTPFIFWFLLYFTWEYTQNNISGIENNSLTMTLFFDPPGIHLYFLYIIIGLYIVTPFLRKVFNRLNEHQTVQFITLLCIFTLCWRMTGFVFVLWLPHLFYFSFTHVKDVIKKHVSNKVSATTFISASVAIAALTAHRFSIQHSSPVFFHEYTTIFVLLQAVSLFTLFYSLENTFQQHFSKHTHSIQYLSGLTFGTYLVSPIIQDILWHTYFIYNPPIHFSAGLIYAHILATIIISAAIIMVVQRIPIAKKII